MTFLAKAHKAIIRDLIKQGYSESIARTTVKTALDMLTDIVLDSNIDLALDLAKVEIHVTKYTGIGDVSPDTIDTLILDPMQFAIFLVLAALTTENPRYTTESIKDVVVTTLVQGSCKVEALDDYTTVYMLHHTIEEEF